jgi:HK97 family phage major capsid protein
MSLIDTRRDAYNAAVTRMHSAAGAIEAAGDDADIDALEAAFTDAQADVERAREALNRAEAIEAARAAHPVEVAERTEPAAARTDSRPADVKVTADRELTYRPDRQGFFRDAFAARFMGDIGAQQRLNRHAQEMDVVYRERGVVLHDPGATSKRDVGTGAFAGLTVPQYLVDEFAAYARAGRPYLDTIRRIPLPGAGMTVNISRITTGTGVAAQASENAGVQETDADDTLLTVNVRTYAGQQDVSRQALERSEMVDTIIYEDLVLAYHTVLDNAALNADGSSGTHLGFRSTSGIATVTYTDASPTAAEAWPKLADAVQQIAAGRFLGATHILMHPRRWGWFTAANDTTGRPLISATAGAPMNAMGTYNAPSYGPVGVMQGLVVVTDANIPTNLGAGTNEDVIVVYRAPDHMLWEEGDGMPRRLRFEETNGGNLTTKLVVYGYSAFTAGRYPLAGATISGSGLVTPTF